MNVIKTIIIAVIAAVVAFLLGALIGYIMRKSVAEKAIGSAEQRARNIILDAETQADTNKRSRQRKKRTECAVR